MPADNRLKNENEQRSSHAGAVVELRLARESFPAISVSSNNTPRAATISQRQSFYWPSISTAWRWASCCGVGGHASTTADGSGTPRAVKRASGSGEVRLSSGARFTTKRRWPGRCRAGRFAHRFVEGQQARGVALLREEVGERGGEGARVVGLRHAGFAGEAHRAAVVHEQVGAQVRLVLEFLDKIAVGAAHEFPIEPARIIARRVRPVLAELDREAVIRRAMQPVSKPLDHRPRPQLQIADAHQRRRVEEAGGFGCGAHSSASRRSSAL